MSKTSCTELQTVLNAMPLLFFQKDTENRILRTNQVVADMLGTSIESIVGTTADQWFADEAGDHFNDDLEVMRTQRARLSIIEQFRLSDLEKQWVCTDKHPHYDESGNVDGILVYSRRVDGNTLAEDQRSELEAQVRYAQKLESIGVLAAGVAHDFNNYLTIIIGSTDMVLERVGHDAPIAKPLENSLKAAYEATRIASQLVTYAGKSVVTSEAVNLSRLILDFMDMIQASVSSSVALTVDLDEDIPAIRVDVVQIHQLLINIAINASDAIGDDHGTIEISTRSRYCSARELVNTVIGSTLSAGEYVVLSIRDSGCGMTNTVLNSLFEPFFSTKTTGRGLGLATVIGTVKGHGGTLYVDSSPENGTTIDLLFPAVNSETATTPPASPHGGLRPAGQAYDSLAEQETRKSPDQSVSRGLSCAAVPGQVAKQVSEQDTVLIVDDSAQIRELLECVLSGSGYRVVTADSGEEAVRLLQQNVCGIDACIVDYCMPGINGLDVFTAVSQLRWDLPFILVSGSANLGSTEDFERLPNVAFLKKPFRSKVLLEKLQALMDARDKLPRVE